jgi:N-acetylglucosaminyldiphosphoundecaprenol N-acetyl-beta-D-mannosaminyltransferase
MNRTEILGVPVDAGTLAEVQDAIRAHLSQGIGCLHVVTLNPEYVMFARRDPAFAEAIQASGLITVDGVGVELALRALRPERPRERVTGVRLTWYMAELASETGARVFLLGAGPGIAERAGWCLVEVHPGAAIAGVWDGGSPRPDDDERTISIIRESGADVLLVAYGAPAQIHWIQRNLPALEAAGIRVVIGIGGAFDYISGNVPWAPSIVRRLGLEWAYRLVREPWRWRRQMVLPIFAVLVLCDVLGKRLARR